MSLWSWATWACRALMASVSSLKGSPPSLGRECIQSVRYRRLTDGSPRTTAAPAARTADTAHPLPDRLQQHVGTQAGDQRRVVQLGGSIAGLAEGARVNRVWSARVGSSTVPARQCSVPHSIGLSGYPVSSSSHAGRLYVAATSHASSMAPLSVW